MSHVISLTVGRRSVVLCIALVLCLLLVVGLVRLNNGAVVSRQQTPAPSVEMQKILALGDALANPAPNRAQQIKEEAAHFVPYSPK